jgi:hypothetical protein
MYPLEQIPQIGLRQTLKPNFIDHHRRAALNYYNKIKRKLGFGRAFPQIKGRSGLDLH